MKRLLNAVADLSRVPLLTCCPHLDVTDDLPEEVA